MFDLWDMSYNKSCLIQGFLNSYLPVFNGFSFAWGVRVAPLGTFPGFTSSPLNIWDGSTEVMLDCGFGIGCKGIEEHMEFRSFGFSGSFLV